jgi:hypothetical protein
MEPEQEVVWTVPPSLIEEIDQWAKESKRSRKAAIAELVRLGLMASQQTHTELRYRQQKTG